MNRFTLRSLSAVVASAVVALSLSPLAANAQAAPANAPAFSQVGSLQIAYGDGDDGAYYVDTSAIAPSPSQVVLAPGDVVYGDGDQGAIAEGPGLTTTLSAAEAGAPQAQADPDVIFTGDDAGGSRVDLSAFHGRSNISAAELAVGQPAVAQDAAAGTQQFVDNDGCD